MKDIIGYEGFYAATEEGQIWSYKSNKFLKGTPNKAGYITVSFIKDKKRKTYYVHRLIAETFLDNPEGLPQVNHIDGCRANNAKSNLEWCDAVYNNNEPIHRERVRKNASKAVRCVELDRVFES